MTLVEVLADSQRAAAVFRDSERLLEAEVAKKGGMSGMAVRTGFKSMKKLRPGIVPHALRVLVPQFAPVVDPHYARARETGNTVGYFTTNADRIAQDLLGVTDARAERADNRVLLRVYRTLRPQAAKHVAAAMPELARLCDQHVGSAAK